MKRKKIIDIEASSVVNIPIFRSMVIYFYYIAHFYSLKKNKKTQNFTVALPMFYLIMYVYFIIILLF